MSAHRRTLCLLLLLAAVAARAQMPAGNGPGQPEPPPPDPGQPQGEPGYPPPPPQAGMPGYPPQAGGPGYPPPSGMPGYPPPGAMPAPGLPHQGNLPNAPGSPASRRFVNLPAVTIKEFRSSVAEVTPRGATDMFIAALVRSRRFRVLERARISEGIAAEKALNQQGMSTGQAGQAQYSGAAYVFEATVSEASAGERRSSFNVGLAGANAGRGSTTDSIAIDVRLTDVESGVVVDAVTVRKALLSVETRVAGVGAALANVFSRGRGSALADVLAPSDEYVNARKDSVDRTLRAAIDEAVGEIARRLADEP